MINFLAMPGIEPETLSSVGGHTTNGAKLHVNKPCSQSASNSSFSLGDFISNSSSQGKEKKKYKQRGKCSKVHTLSCPSERSTHYELWFFNEAFFKRVHAQRVSLADNKQLSHARYKFVTHICDFVTCNLIVLTNAFSEFVDEWQALALLFWSWLSHSLITDLDDLSGPPVVSFVSKRA
uniref:Uncharacterized protein n=1 Tax=Timema genevievae TaxID=629358 RepID=A0A7R9PIV5_TIMGE|nr:unnamed protein product [Timema genevievae]